MILCAYTCLSSVYCKYFLRKTLIRDKPLQNQGARVVAYMHRDIKGGDCGRVYGTGGKGSRGANPEGKQAKGLNHTRDKHHR